MDKLGAPRSDERRKAAHKISRSSAPIKARNVMLAIPSIVEVSKIAGLDTLQVSTDSAGPLIKHDLLTFQLVHFGDDTKPEHWFIDAETAVNFQPDMNFEPDDLGYYDDGIKRTLTDEQIAMFRHSEVQDLLKECRLQREEQEYEMEMQETGNDVLMGKQQASPVSDASSLETELVDTSVLHNIRPLTFKRQLSPSSRSDTSRSTNSSAKRHRKAEVPYAQRKKRNWEQYIHGEDEVHGSITQRRTIREMDEQRVEDIIMDYGDDGSAKPNSQRIAAGDGRRLPVSYEDV